MRGVEPPDNWVPTGMVTPPVQASRGGKAKQASKRGRKATKQSGARATGAGRKPAVRKSGASKASGRKTADRG